MKKILLLLMVCVALISVSCISERTTAETQKNQLLQRKLNDATLIFDGRINGGSGKSVGSDYDFMTNSSGSNRLYFGFYDGTVGSYIGIVTTLECGSAQMVDSAMLYICANLAEGITLIDMRGFGSTSLYNEDSPVRKSKK